MPSIKLKGQTVEYSVRKSKRAKRISMRVDIKKGLEVVYPAGITQPPARDIIKTNQAWVLSTLEKFQTRLENQFQRKYTQGEIFRYLGEDKTLNLIQKTHGTAISIKLSGDQLDVSLPPEVEPADGDTIQYAIEGFYRHQAKAYLAKRTREIASKLGLEYNRITIKNQKTRWGSCSSNKNLNFNLRLMMTPPEAIDYIIVHELCHLVHMNHSKAFWNLVGKHCPTYKHWRKWFKENSPLLIL